MIGRRSVSQLPVSVITPAVDRAASREATSVPGTQRQARGLNPARYRYRGEPVEVGSITQLAPVVAAPAVGGTVGRHSATV